MELNKTYLGHALGVLQTFPDQCVNCCVTSPPYWGLRDYKTPDVDWPEVTYSLFGFEVNVPPWSGQLGLEPTAEMFVGHIVLIFREVYRVLKKDGTLWLNFGDSYASTNIMGNREKDGRSGLNSFKNGKIPPYHQNVGEFGERKRIQPGVKPKDLYGIPWMVAFALRDDGWYLRQDIIWSKPNPMPESVTDRCTKSHEYLFLLSKSRRYYFDAEAIKRPAKDPEDDLRRISKATLNGKSTPNELHNGIRKAKSGNKERKYNKEKYPENSGKNQASSVPWEGVLANKRSVWTVATSPFKDAHYATFPPELIVDCIKAGCPIDGVVLDTFHGAGTTAIVARKLNRNYIGIELKDSNILMTEKRLYNELGMFK